MSDSLGDLSIVVLSFNRRDALARTLGELCSTADAGAQVIVVDNASSDGSAGMVGERFGWAELVELDQNVAIEGFNRGAARADREFVLILDDDSWPEAGAIERAMAMMRVDGRLGGMMLHRRHPKTMEFEWPFDHVDSPQRGWPDMGCGNLVRLEAWRQVGGYESAFFLYRNDTDLALKLLGAGWDVAFDPRIRVRLDSPVVKNKTPRWFELSTRNWVWMCKRHGRGLGRVTAICLGWLWAHRLARCSAIRHWRAFRGFVAGVSRAAPGLEESVRADGSALRRLVALKLRHRGW